MVKKKILKKGKKKNRVRETDIHSIVLVLLVFQSELANKKCMRRGGNCQRWHYTALPNLSKKKSNFLQDYHFSSGRPCVCKKQNYIFHKGFIKNRGVFFW